MKKKLSILAAGILAGTLCAQNAVTVKQKQYSGWKARDFACNQQAEIVNDKNFYQFNLLQLESTEFLTVKSRSLCLLI